jgi:hypothetical protein
MTSSYPGPGAVVDLEDRYVLVAVLFCLSLHSLWPVPGS